MIAGGFDASGYPTVEGRLVVPRLGVSYRVPFLVDTGADGTCLHPRDGIQAGIPFGRLRDGVTVGGIGGQSTYYEEPAILMFTDDAEGQTYAYHVVVDIAKPEDVSDEIPSLLGRDIIDRWRMVYDRTDDVLEFTVRSADAILDVEGSPDPLPT